jgi:hypothetical protein
MLKNKFPVAKEPWPHIIIDNYLDKETFNFLSKIRLKKVKSSKDISISHNKVFIDGRIEGTALPKSFIRDFQKKYHKKNMAILSQLAPKKVKLYDYSDFSLVVTPPGSSFPIHEDVPTKLLSCVVYVYPKKSPGTFLYANKKGGIEKEVKWKVNRALFFSRKTAETFHSYKGHEKNDRLALVYNLCTTKYKEVFKAENKSYFFYYIKKKIKYIIEDLKKLNGTYKKGYVEY